jgi:hypothetical protein
MARVRSAYGETRNAHKSLVGKPEGKKPLQSPRPKWQDNIKVDTREMKVGDLGWIHPVRDKDQ